jgi:quercetin dioxygenase-like cupin family protein
MAGTAVPRCRRKSVLKLQNDDTEQSVMMFEETAPVGTVTPTHLHHDSDEAAYVLSGEITFKRITRATSFDPRKFFLL